MIIRNYYFKFLKPAIKFSTINDRDKDSTLIIKNSLYSTSTQTSNHSTKVEVPTKSYLDNFFLNLINKKTMYTIKITNNCKKNLNKFF